MADNQCDNLSETKSEVDFLENETSDSEEPYCVNGVENNKQMIVCKYEWFHYVCIYIDPKNIPVSSFVCEFCKKKFQASKTKGKSGKSTFDKIILSLLSIFKSLHTCHTTQLSEVRYRYAPIRKLSTLQRHIFPSVS